MQVIVIPNITYANENYFNIMLNGIEESKVVAFSIKGLMKNNLEKELLKKAIKYTVNNLFQLKRIIIYNVGINDIEVYSLFNYAIAKGIEIVIPDNVLKLRNIERSHK